MNGHWHYTVISPRGHVTDHAAHVRDVLVKAVARFVTGEGRGGIDLAHGRLHGDERDVRNLTLIHGGHAGKPSRVGGGRDAHQERHHRNRGLSHGPVATRPGQEEIGIPRAFLQPARDPHIGDDHFEFHLAVTERKQIDAERGVARGHSRAPGKVVGAGGVGLAFGQQHGFLRKTGAVDLEQVVDFGGGQTVAGQGRGLQQRRAPAFLEQRTCGRVTCSAHLCGAIRNAVQGRPAVLTGRAAGCCEKTG